MTHISFVFENTSIDLFFILHARVCGCVYSWLISEHCDERMGLLGDRCKDCDCKMWTSTENLFAFYRIVDKYYYQLVDTRKRKVTHDMASVFRVSGNRRSVFRYLAPSKASLLLWGCVRGSRAVVFTPPTVSVVLYLSCGVTYLAWALFIDGGLDRWLV